MNYESALEYIHAVQWAGHKPGLTRTRTLLAALGDPHKQLRFIHVAGTNGKGSTAAMLASCLQAAGYRVGLYTSPFINRFNERIQINGQQIPDEALVELVEQVKPAADAMEDVPTEFEIITALGMLYFAQQQCDIVVLEVGLGGTLDSTNVIEKPACAVITALGMDHVKELGPTLADIAAAKAGIIKPGCPVVSYGGAPEADAVLRRVAAQQHAPFTEVDFAKLQITGGDLDAVPFSFDGLDGVRLPLIGSYQPRNAALAITALRVLRQQGWNIPESAIRAGLEQVSWPGRFELLRHSPAFVLDGSHNAHGMRATVQSLKDRFPGQKFVFQMNEAEKAATRALQNQNLAAALAQPCDLLVLDEATSGLDPAARSEILDILLDFIQDERHSVLLSSHITTDLEQIADTIAYLHHGQLLFAKNKDDLMEEYGILRCSQQDLDRLPPEWIAATCRTAAGCESLVHPRVSVLRALPGVVCDAASIDDIMRLTSKEG